MSTAYRHFYRAIEQAQKDGAFGDYDLVGDILIKPEECDWRYNTPFHNNMEETGYVVWMEPVDKSNCSGWLVYDGKIIPSWGCGMSFIVDEFGFRCDYPEAVPKYVRERLKKLIG